MRVKHAHSFFGHRRRRTTSATRYEKWSHPRELFAPRTCGPAEARTRFPLATLFPIRLRRQEPDDGGCERRARTLQRASWRELSCENSLPKDSHAERLSCEKRRAGRESRVQGISVRSPRGRGTAIEPQLDASRAPVVIDACAWVLERSIAARRPKTRRKASYPRRANAS